MIATALQLSIPSLCTAAILGFVVQEALYGKPVVEQTPFFFHPAEGLF